MITYKTHKTQIKQWKKHIHKIWRANSIWEASSQQQVKSSDGKVEYQIDIHLTLWHICKWTFAHKDIKPNTSAIALKITEQINYVYIAF